LLFDFAAPVSMRVFQPHFADSCNPPEHEGKQNDPTG